VSETRFKYGDARSGLAPRQDASLAEVLTEVRERLALEAEHAERKSTRVAAAHLLARFDAAMAREWQEEAE